MTFRRREDQRTTEQRKKDFLTHFGQVGNVTQACKATRLGRTIIYEWLSDDTAFDQAFRDAEKEATENLEAEAYRRAVKGVKQKKGYYYLGERVGEDIVTEYSDTLLIFLLKGRAPEKYRERTSLEHSGTLNLRELSDDDLDARISELAAAERDLIGAAGREEATPRALEAIAGPADTGLPQ